MKISKRIYVTISLLAVLSLGLGSVVAIPTILSVRNLRIKIRQAQVTMEREYFLTTQTRNSLGKLNEAKGAIRTLSTYAAIEGDELSFVSAMETASENADIEQTIVIRSGSETELTPWEKEVPLSIDARGNFGNFLVYLYKIEKLPFYVTFQSIDLKSQPTAKEGAGAVVAHIEATVHLLAKDQPVFESADISTDGGQPAGSTD
jgi:hypothetical protein